jgi:Uma2 family endonuclease
LKLGLVEPKAEKSQTEIVGLRAAFVGSGCPTKRRIEVMGAPLHKLSLPEFMAWEADQEGRNEFHRGEVFAMVGGRRGHSRIIANLVRHLGNHLDGSPCQVFSEGMKVQIGDDTVVYPDVFVTCDKRFRFDEQVITEPVLVVEVLSPATQGYDRSAKFAFYRRLSSLREYALIDPDTRRVEVFRPGDDEHWKLFDIIDDAVLELASVGARIALSDVFQGMDSGSESATE